MKPGSFFSSLLLMLYAAACFVAVNVDKDNATDLYGFKGIGPVISDRIIDKRKNRDFKSWTDFIDRVKGLGDENAAKLSVDGVTVNGPAFNGAPGAPAVKADTCPAAATPAADSAAKI